MDLLFGTLWLVAAAACGVGALVWRDRTWARVARDYGLHYEAASIVGERRLSGEVNGVPVDVGTERDAAAKPPRRTLFSAGQGTIPPTVSARTEGGWRRLVKVFVASDREIGDKHIDRRLHLEGDPLELSAVMSHQGRNLLLKLLEDHPATLEAGVIRSDKRGWLILERRLRAHLDEVLQVATELSASSEALPARLRYNALHDPVQPVRDICARTLLGSYPDSQEALDVATARTHSPDSEIRMLAALVLREVEAVMELIGDQTLAQQARALGVRHLARVDRRRGLEVVIAALGGKPGAVRVAACQAVGDYALREALPAMDAMASTARDPEGSPILDAALDLGGPAQAASVAWVFDKLDSRERARGARFIRDRGDLRSVEPLALMSRGPLRSAAVKQTARALVGELQARLHRPSRPGALTLVEEATGGLALTPDVHDGALSPAAPTVTTIDDGEQVPP